MKVALLLCLVMSVMYVESQKVPSEAEPTVKTGSNFIKLLSGVGKGMISKFGFGAFGQGNEMFHVAKLEYERMIQHINDGKTAEALWYGWHSFNKILDGLFDYCGGVQEIQMDIDQMIRYVDGSMDWGDIKFHIELDFVLNCQEIILQLQEENSAQQAGDYYKIGFATGIIIMDLAFNSRGIY